MGDGRSAATKMFEVESWRVGKQDGREGEFQLRIVVDCEQHNIRYGVGTLYCTRRGRL